MHIPDSVIKRLAGAKDQKQEGVDLCIDLMQQIQEIEGVSGIHLMAYRQEHRIGEIVTKSKVLGTRVPWSPGTHTGAVHDHDNPQFGNQRSSNRL